MVGAQYRDQGRLAEALPLVRTATESGYVNRSVHLSILLGAKHAKVLSEDKATTESFTVVQRAASTAASAAVSQLAVRFADFKRSGSAQAQRRLGCAVSL